MARDVYLKLVESAKKRLTPAVIAESNAEIRERTELAEELQALKQRLESENAMAVSAELDRLRRKADELDERGHQTSKRFRKLIVGVAQAGVTVELATAALELITPAYNPRPMISIDFYSAVAVVVPVLLIAGFVEIAIVAGRAGTWGVVSFAIPAFGAETAALDVLALHRGNGVTLYFAIWGLFTTAILLVLYVSVHAASANNA